jgi:hypothetical protein
MKNHAVSGLTRKAQKDKLENFLFFIFLQNMQNKETMQSVCFDRETTHGTKKTNWTMFFLLQNMQNIENQAILFNTEFTQGTQKRQT